MSVTGEQDAIIAHDIGPSLILAVAGAGKTTTLMRRIARLIRSGVSPQAILLTTFTRLGAADMRRRANELGVPGTVRFRTLHSVAWGMIKAAKPQWTLPPEWWVRETIKEAAERYLSRGSDDDDIEIAAPTRQILSAIGCAKANMIYPDAWTSPDGLRTPGWKEWAATQKYQAKTIELVDACYRALEEARKNPTAAGRGPSTFKRGEIACTHDDAIADVAKAISMNEGWTQRHLGSFEHVIVDEAQDSNLSQWVLVRFLSQTFIGQAPTTGEEYSWQNLMICGDDSQAIYGWRGARPDLLRNFMLQEGPALSLYRLSTNFRSGQAILDVANKILGFADDRLFDGDLQCGRPEIKAVVTTDEFETAHEEAELAADEIERQLASGVPAREIAVLYRVNATSGSIEMELIRRKIPCRVAGRSFFQRPEVDAAVKYIALALDHDDRDAWSTIYRVPTRYIKRQILSDFPTFSAFKKGNRGEICAKYKNAYRLMRDVDGVVRKLEESGLTAAIEYVFEIVGVRNHFVDQQQHGDQESLGVTQAMNELKECAKAAGSPEEFLRIAQETKRQDRVGMIEDGDGEKTDNRVTLSTVHGAKGLEWQCLHILGASQGLFPLLDSDQAEERRLFYVATTRAKQWLRISWSGANEGRPVPSRFVYDAGLLDMPRNPDGSIDDRYNAPKITLGEPDGDRLVVGDYVTHFKYGAGVVASVNAVHVEVKFGKGNLVTFPVGIVQLRKKTWDELSRDQKLEAAFGLNSHEVRP